MFTNSLCSFPCSLPSASQFYPQVTAIFSTFLSVLCPLTPHSFSDYIAFFYLFIMFISLPSPSPPLQFTFT